MGVVLVVCNSATKANMAHSDEKILQAWAEFVDILHRLKKRRIERRLSSSLPATDVIVVGAK